MACGCRRARTGRDASGIEARAMPHDIRPGESCVFCAEKHLAIAYQNLVGGSGFLPLAIGELELARRHTAVQFGEVSKELAGLELLACLRQRDRLLSGLDRVQGLVAAEVARQDPDRVDHGEVSDFVPAEPGLEVSSLLVGEVHFCAAWRLAFEVGYMVPNRLMVIGDLGMAREQLARHDYALQSRMRDLRHRVQTIRGADLDICWIAVAQALDRLVTSRLPGMGRPEADALGRFLGLA